MVYYRSNKGRTYHCRDHFLLHKGKELKQTIQLCTRSPISYNTFGSCNPDVLHLFLRVTDVLFNLLVTDIRRLDGIERCLEGLPPTSSMSKLEKFLNDTCHIPFMFSICKETKSLQWRDLMGPEKHILLNKINFPVLIPQLPNVDAIQALWKSFQRLHKSLHSMSVSDEDADRFGIDASRLQNLQQFIRQRMLPRTFILWPCMFLNFSKSTKILSNSLNKVWKS